MFSKNAEISLSIDSKSAENNLCDVSIYPSCVYHYKNVRVLSLLKELFQTLYTY